MFAAKRTRASVALAFVALASACSDDKGSEPVPDSGVNLPADGGASPVLDGQVDAQAAIDGQVPIDAQPHGDAHAGDAALRLQYCLPRPGAPLRAPLVGLPCELIPPGIEL